VEAAALADLHVHAQRALVEDLPAVHAQVRPVAARVLGQHQRQRQEPPAVARPALRRRQRGETRWILLHVEHRPVAAALRADSRQRGEERAPRPELAEAGREELARQRGRLADQRLGPRAERELDAALRPEEVGRERERAAAHVAEEQRLAAGRDHAPVDLRHLELGVDLGRDLGELALGPQPLEEFAQVARSVRASGGRGAHAAALSRGRARPRR
jgi:hypothetical protein